MRPIARRFLERTRVKRSAGWAGTREQSRHCVNEAWHRAANARRAGERDGASGGGGFGLSRGVLRNGRATRSRWTGPRRRIQSRRCASDARRAGERDGASVEEAVFGLSRGASGKDARQGPAGLGRDAEQSRPCAHEARGAGERHGASGGGGCGLSRGATGANARQVPLEWAATRKKISAMRFQRSASGRAARRVWRRRLRAYRAALLERTRDKVPLDWAMAQNNLGAALQMLGEREAETDKAKGCATLKTARDHYAAALEDFQQAGASLLCGGGARQRCAARRHRAPLRG